MDINGVLFALVNTPQSQNTLFTNDDDDRMLSVAEEKLGRDRIMVIWQFSQATNALNVAEWRPLGLCDQLFLDPYTTLAKITFRKIFFVDTPPLRIDLYYVVVV